MTDARKVDLAALSDEVGGIDLVLIDPEAMFRHARVCRERGIDFAAGPSGTW